MAENVRTVKKIQQYFGELSGFENTILWDFYSQDDEDFLKMKLKQLYPDVINNNVINDKAINDNVINDDATNPTSEQRRMDKLINTIRATMFDSIWSQRKYNNKHLMASIIYILVTNSENSFEAALNSEQYTCHVVFRIRKCLKNGSSRGCCIVFVDESGRVYQNWNSYVQENDLPAGLMIAPRDGIYMLRDGKVILDHFNTPANKLEAKLLNIADTTTLITSTGAAAVPLVALAAPIAAPIIITAGVVGLASAGYTAIRSGFNLYDLRQHERSISLTNAEARNSWLSAVGGFIGMGAFSATKIMTTAAANGIKISTNAKLAVNALNISTVAISGSGVAVVCFDMFLRYKDDDPISVMDVLQLAASLALFTHSVCNITLANQLINETQNATIKSFKENCSKNQQKMFNKLTKETIRINGEQNGKADIIRNAKTIDKQSLNDLFKINKQLNKANVRPSFTTEGKGIILNNDIKVDTAVLRQSVQHNVGPNILEQVQKPIPASHPSSNFNNDSANIQLLNKTNLTAGMEVAHIIYKNIESKAIFKEIVNCMISTYSKDIVAYLVKLCERFSSQYLAELQRQLQRIIPSEEILYQLNRICKNLQSDVLRNIAEHGERIIKKMLDFYNSLQTIPSHGAINCDKCGGTYTIVTI